MSKMMNDAQEAPECLRHLLTQNQAVYEELGDRLRSLSPRVVATIARGSSDHAATYASYLIPLCTGRVVASVAPSLVSVLKAPLNLEGQFALAISQSGRSPDIISTVEHAVRAGALTAAIINDTESPVAQAVDFLLPQHAGSEGIAATKTVLCTLAAIARMTGHWAGDQDLLSSLEALPATLESALKQGLLFDADILKDVSSAYILSRGLGLSSALELALKLKETCGIHAEAFSTAEVRHGPREIVDEGFLVIALAMGPAREDILRAASEMRDQGARVFVVNETDLPSAGDSRLTPLVTLQALYPWLVRSSQALGFDPDKPKTLKSKVIKTV